MSGGEVLTRGAIFVALALAVAGSADRWLSPSRRRWAKWAWTSACLAYLVHVAAAFHHYHQWSHAAAYRETARQTAELFRLDWGGGLYVNYAFTVAWVADVAWRWRRPEGPRGATHALTTAWRAFFLFMVLNGAVVFGSTPARWLGSAVCVALVVLWWGPVPGRAR